MKTWRAVGAAVFAAASVHAQNNLVITSFHGNGELTWDAPRAGTYLIEWASSLTGAWHRSWDLVDLNVVAGPQTNAVPMYYRVRTAGPSLLIHGDGFHGSQAFTDECGHAVTPYGNVQVSTNRSKFGGGSIHFDGAGDYLWLATNAAWAFGSGDFTVDFWVNFDGSPGDVSFIGPHTQHISAEWTVLREGANLSSRLSGLLVVNQPWAPQTDTWYHIALTREGSTVRLFVDGQILGTGPFASSISNVLPLTIGAANNPSLFFRGYMDEIRVVKGLAAWTAPFTPPSAAYEW